MEKTWIQKYLLLLIITAALIVLALYPFQLYGVVPTSTRLLFAFTIGLGLVSWRSLRAVEWNWSHALLVTNVLLVILSVWKLFNLHLP